MSTSTKSQAMETSVATSQKVSETNTASNAKPHANDVLERVVGAGSVATMYVANGCSVPYFDTGEDNAELVPMNYLIIGVKDGVLAHFADGITVVQE